MLEVDLDAMIHNLNYFRSKLSFGTRLVAMVKAGSYGTGDFEVAQLLQHQGVNYLAVAFADEGVVLRERGITMPVVVLNADADSFEQMIANRLEPEIYSFRSLDAFSRAADRAGRKHYPIHIKLDTGMHRIGFSDDELHALADTLKELPRLRVASVFSHLATADCLDQDNYTHLQLDSFERMSTQLSSHLGIPVRRHILNTAGMMRFGHGSSSYDMGRLGIGLYGISPLPPGATSVELKPVASLSTTIMALRSYPAGTTVGYGRRGLLNRESTVATLPIGYADGIDRRLGRGAANFIVRGTECPTIGNICMDMCMIDVTDVPGVEIGDSVEIFGPTLPIERISDTLGTIPYEILTSISPRVRRIYFRE